MPKPNLIHVRFDYRESLLAKKDVLSSEIFLLRMAKAINRYNFFREQEAELKINFYKRLKRAKADILRLQKLIPEPKIPKILKKERYEEKEEPPKPKMKPSRDRGLDEQLREIQMRLANLQGRAASA